MKKNYQVISGQDRRALAHWLTKNGQGLLPLVELVEGAPDRAGGADRCDRARDHRGGWNCRRCRWRASRSAAAATVR